MGAPSIKVRKVENFWDKISLTGCQWSNLNAPGSETPVSQSLLEESIFPFPASAPSYFLFSGVIRNGSPQYKGQEDGQISEQNQFNRLQMVQFECSRVRNPCVSFTVSLAPTSSKGLLLNDKMLIRGSMTRYIELANGRIKEQDQ